MGSTPATPAIWKLKDLGKPKSFLYNTNVLEGQTSQINTWFLSPNSGYSGGVFFVNSDGSMYDYGSNGGSGVIPVLYLKSSIQILSGNGSKQKPYVLSSN